MIGNRPIPSWCGSKRPRYLDEPLTNRGAYHLHLGSGAWPVRLRLVEGSELEGSGPAILQLSQPLPLKAGDRFILREVGRRAVVGGGRVLDPHPASRIPQVRPTTEILQAVSRRARPTIKRPLFSRSAAAIS